MNVNNFKNISRTTVEDVLKWRRNLSLSTSCISNIIESGESTNNNSIMDKNKFNNNSIMKENISAFSSSSSAIINNNNNINSGIVGTTKVSNFYVTLAKESPNNINCDSSSDTYDSFHLRETDYCKDTTDTLSDSSYTTEGIATVDVVEYEVASRSASEDLYSNDSSSGTEDIFITVAARTAASTILQQCDSSTSDFADTEESSDDIKNDTELSSADYWNCVKCKNKQNNPMFRYCERCYQIRKSHFPPRPTQWKSRAVKSKVSSLLNKFNSTLSNRKSLSSLSDNSEDSKDIFNNEHDNNTAVKMNEKVSSDCNNSKGFGKFNINNNNNNNNNNNEANSNKKNCSGPSSLRHLNYKNNKSSKNQLNNAVESSTSDDDDFDGSINNNNNITNLKEHKINKKIDEVIKEDENFSVLDSEDDEIYNINKQLNQNDSSKKTILRNTISITNFFSTPKFNKNLKRKNPFQISLTNNAKRIFVNNSSCSSVTNLTNEYSSSNNSSLTTAITTINNANCSNNIVEKRDTNLLINDSETDLALKFISSGSNSLKLQKDSGFSSASGPSSSQEYYLSQGSNDFGCSSSHSDEPGKSTNSICKNNNNIKIFSSIDSNISSSSNINGISHKKSNSIMKNNNSSKLPISHEITKDFNNIMSDDTVSEELDEREYDCIDDEDFLNNDQNIDENHIKLSQQETIGNLNIINQTNNLESVTAHNDNIGRNLLAIPKYVNLRKHISDFTVSAGSNEFSPTIKINSVVTRSVSTCSDACNIINSPTSTTNNSFKVMRNQRRHRKILGQFNMKNKNNNESSKKCELLQEEKEQQTVDGPKNDCCIICLDEPKNGVFVHSRFLHLCCCYRCAVKIWNKNKKCPVCNCAVKNVMKLFIH